MFSTFRFACLTVLKTRLVSSITGQSQTATAAKRHFKSEFARFQISLLLFHSIQFVKCLGFFCGVNSEDLDLSSEKEKENCCLEFTSSLRRSDI